MAKAIALISGSLDSEVAAALAKEAGLEITCAEFACPFQHRTGAAQVAERWAAPLVTLAPGADFLDVVRRPRFNFGGGPLSCLECRLKMLVAANEKRVELGAELLVTGEVLGQRAANQSRRQIDLITYHSGAVEALYRPLSAQFLGVPKILKGTSPLGISGSGRRPIKAIAKRLGIPDVDRAGPQCRLSDPGYTARLDDLLMHQPEIDAADLELLLLGRHYRLSRQAKAVVGRNAGDNAALADWFARHRRGRLFVPANFQGASVQLTGQGDVDIATALSLSAARKSESPTGGFLFQEGAVVVTLDAVVGIERFTPLQAP